MSVVTVEKNGAVARVTVAREKALNALNKDVLDELLAAAVDLEAQSDVRAVLLTGAGSKSFVAGADISAMAEMPPADAQAFSRLGAAVAKAIEHSRLPWIAVVQGFALGGGCELALACDCIYASDRAKFGQPEVKLGVIPGFGGTQRLERRVGIAKAKELVFTGDMIGAEEALRIGLCDQLVPGDDLLKTAEAAALRMAANGPLAVAAAKRVINRGHSLPLDDALEEETLAFGGLFETEDQREGMAAFLAKRAPNFQGR